MPTPPEATGAPSGRVALIDDDAGILAALRELLEFEGYACDCHPGADSFMHALRSRPAGAPVPDCIVCDVKMPGMGGLELQAALGPEAAIPLVLMSGLSGIDEAVTGFRAGAVDFLTKPVDDEALLAAVARAVAAGRSSRDTGQRRERTAELVGRLSDREREVAQLVAQGLTNLGISLQLGITPRTVKFHRQRIMEKLGIAGVPDLVRILEAYGRAGRGAG